MLQLHILISGGIQLGLLVLSMLLLIGIARRVKCLFIPWLIIFGLTQMAILGSVLACVIYLPSDFKVYCRDCWLHQILFTFLYLIILNFAFSFHLFYFLIKNTERHLEQLTINELNWSLIVKTNLRFWLCLICSKIWFWTFERYNQTFELNLFVNITKILVCNVNWFKEILFSNNPQIITGQEEKTQLAIQ